MHNDIMLIEIVRHRYIFMGPPFTVSKILLYRSGEHVNIKLYRFFKM